jgi:hypothetical protein
MRPVSSGISPHVKFAAFGSLLLIALFSRAPPALAATPGACASAPFAEARSLAQLPHEVSVALGAERKGLDGIADREGKFNRTDVANTELPMRRFSLGAVAPNCVLAAVEHGGVAYYVELLAFERTRNAWRAHKLAIMNSGPRSLAELISRASK